MTQAVLLAHACQLLRSGCHVGSRTQFYRKLAEFGTPQDMQECWDAGSHRQQCQGVAYRECHKITEIKSNALTSAAARKDRSDPNAASQYYCTLGPCVNVVAACGFVKMNCLSLETIRAVLPEKKLLVGVA